MKTLIRSIVIVISLLTLAWSPVWAGSLTIPNTFTSGTTASASEVNANFTAVETAVDDNNSRISQNTAAIPGISTIALNSSSTLSASNSNVLSITVNAPDNGFVLVTANGMIQLNSHTTAGFSSVYVGVSNISATLDVGNYTRFYLSANVPNGSFEIPYSAHSLFSVSQGVNTFYLVARENGQTGSSSIWFNRLTACMLNLGFRNT